MDMIFAALNTWVAIGQINGDPEKKTDDLLRKIEEVLKSKETVKSITLFRHYKKESASLLKANKRRC